MHGYGHSKLLLPRICFLFFQNEELPEQHWLSIKFYATVATTTESIALDLWMDADNPNSEHRHSILIYIAVEMEYKSLHF